MSSSSSTSSLWSPHHSQLASRLPNTPVREQIIIEQPRSTTTDKGRTEDEENEISPLVLEIQPRITELDMLLEYKLVAEKQLPGVYVIPSPNSLLEWHGVMFVHTGLYRGGVFLFTLFVPDNYPQMRPMVKFRTKVYHPYVHQTNYVFNMLRAFPDWNPGQHHICDVLGAVRHCFLHEEGLGGDRTTSFTKLVRQCVQDSISSPPVTDPQSLIHLTTITEELMEEARRLIHTGELPAASSPANTSFFDQVSTQFGHVSSQFGKMLDSFIS